MPRKRNSEIAATDVHGDDPQMEIEETGAIVGGDGDDPIATAPAFFLNLADADAEFENIPPGTRAIVVCTGAEAKISGNGNIMIDLRVKTERIVTTPNNDPNADRFRNRTIRNNVMFIAPNPVTGKRGTLWSAKLTFEAFGIEWAARGFATQAKFMQWLHASAEQFIGGVAEAEIGIEKNDGNINPSTGEAYPPRNVIARFHKYDPPAVDYDNDDLAPEYDHDYGDDASDDEPPF